MTSLTSCHSNKPSPTCASALTFHFSLIPFHSLRPLAAAIAAILHLIPHFFPLLPPGKGTIAHHAHLLRQMLLLYSAHVLLPTSKGYALRITLVVEIEVNKMKLGIISDIHGDVYRLKQALAVLEANDVHKIVCAGDIVQGISRADEVVKIITEKHIECVRGNHDRWYFEFDKDRDQSDSTSQFLLSLPQTRKLTLNEMRILIAHGTPWNDAEIVTADTLSHHADRFAAELASQYDLLILGHTHRPMLVRLGNLQIINPGSICKIYPNDSATCAVYALREQTLTIYEVKTGNVIYQF
jgi:putative phosphoesterase